MDCVELLRQGVELIERLDGDSYNRMAGLHSRSGVGSHFRHCLDSIDSFFEGIKNGYVDYNSRKRDTSTEHEPAAAIDRLRKTIASFEALCPIESDLPLMVSLESSAAGDGPRKWCLSTVLRELQFLQSHLTHHYALIALMSRLQHIEPGAEFGVTPSTLEYWRSQEQCAR